MKPISIDHTNVFDDFKDVLVNIELTDEDKLKIYKNHMNRYGDDYDYKDVSMLVWVNVEDREVKGINYMAYYPGEQGECDIDFYNNNDFCTACESFVTTNYFGNEDKYDL